MRTMKIFCLGAALPMVLSLASPCQADSGVRNPALLIGSIPVLITVVALVTTALLTEDSRTIDPVLPSNLPLKDQTNPLGTRSLLRTPESKILGDQLVFLSSPFLR